MSYISDGSDISNELTYSMSYLSKTLGLGESTVRKYCALLVKNEYEFRKNNAGYRVYFQSDIDVLRDMISLKNDNDYTLEVAAKMVVSGDDTDDIDDVSDMNAMADMSEYNKLMDEFKSYQDKQNEFNKKMLNQLDRQYEHINKRLEERDRVLLVTLQESMETRKQIAATEKNKKKWWQFWR